MTRKRTGSITTTPEGRLRVRVTQNGQRRSLKSYATEDEAKAMLAALQRTLEVEDPPTTFSTWVDGYLDARELGREIVDVRGERSRAKVYIAGDALGGIETDKIRRADVVAWVRRMRGRGLAKQTIQNALNLVRGALGAAVDEGKAKANVAHDVRLGREARTEDVWHYLDLEGQARILAAAGPDWPMIGFAIGTGLRAGELVSLRLADVHADHVVVRFGKPPSEPTKGKRIREVPLLELAAASVEAQRLRLAGPPPRRLRGVWPNPHGLLFPGAAGAFRSPQHVIKWAAWTELRECARAPEGFRWHDLRHTCASSLVSGLWGRKWALDEVRDLLGHTSVTTTERYAHLAGTALQQAASETPKRGLLDGPIGRVIGRAAVAAATIGALSLGNSAEPLSRLELETYGLRKPRFRPSDQGLGPSRDQIRTVCEALLAAVAAGAHEARELAQARLAALVMSLPVPVLVDVAATLLDALAASQGEERAG